MHHASLNLPDLFLSLWRGTLDCDKSNDRTTWQWAVLKGNVWAAHGKHVADAIPYLPGCFDKAPRNIAEKVSSGYKAAEFETWFYGYGPAMLYGVLPHKFWQHYCKLVMALRLVHQRSITLSQVKLVDKLLISFCKEFELFYCD